jgi:sulfur-oxidizing protein SoxX
LRIKTLAVSAIGAALLLCAGQNTGSAAEMAKLVAYKVVDHGIPKSLTGKAGNAVEGRKVAIHRQKGNCLACHVMPIPEQQFHGEIGPDLAGVGSRYKEAELRLRVVDPKVLNEDTIMPAFYKVNGLHEVHKNFKGKSVLSAQEVEDVVAYLMTLK